MGGGSSEGKKGVSSGLVYLLTLAWSFSVSSSMYSKNERGVP